MTFLFDQVIGKPSSFPITGSVIKHERKFMFYQLTSYPFDVMLFLSKQKTKRNDSDERSNHKQPPHFTDHG